MDPISLSLSLFLPFPSLPFSTMSVLSELLPALPLSPSIACEPSLVNYLLLIINRLLLHSSQFWLQSGGDGGQCSHHHCLHSLSAAIYHCCCWASSRLLLLALLCSAFSQPVGLSASSTRSPIFFVCSLRVPYRHSISFRFFPLPSSCCF